MHGYFNFFAFCFDLVYLLFNFRESVKLPRPIEHDVVELADFFLLIYGFLFELADYFLLLEYFVEKWLIQLRQQLPHLRLNIKPQHIKAGKVATDVVFLGFLGWGGVFSGGLFLLLLLLL